MGVTVLGIFTEKCPVYYRNFGLIVLLSVVACSLLRVSIETLYVMTQGPALGQGSELY